MKTEFLKMTKEVIRENFKKIRKTLSTERRKKASMLAFSFLKTKTKKYKNILSFASKKNEIDIWNFNNFLEKNGRLFLTKINHGNLLIYKISDIKKDLILNKHFYLLEPNPNRCEIVSLDKIDLILVPGISFDRKNHRLGYGKGYYDKLLTEKKIVSFGIGFMEQFSKKAFLIKENDISLDKVYLF